MPLKVLFAHDVVFRETGKKDALLGRFISFSDSSDFGSLPRAFFIDGFQSKDELGNLESVRSIIFGFAPEKDYNKELGKFHEMLKSHPNRVAKIIFDKFDSKAVIYPISSIIDEELLKGAGYRKGFVCKVLQNNNPEMSQSQSQSQSQPESQSSINWEEYINKTSSSAPVPATNTNSATFNYFNDFQQSHSTDKPIVSSVAPSNLSVPPTSSAPIVTPGIAVSSTLPEDHYNKLKRNKDTRHQSQLFHMRNLNNFVKTELIEESAILNRMNRLMQSINLHQGLKVLDLACGKGGDVNKWLRNSQGVQEYIGIDIAENSIKEFVDRLLKNNDREKISKLIVGNLNVDSLTSSSLLTHQWKNQGMASDWNVKVPLSFTDLFDVISCQFAMHYMFENKDSTNHFFEEISRHLKDKSYFIATTIDCRVLLHYILKSRFGEKESTMPPYPGYEKLYKDDPEKNATRKARNGENKVAGLKTKVFYKPSPHDKSGKDYKYLGLQIWNEFDKLLLQINIRDDMLQRLIFQQKQQSIEDTQFSPLSEDSFGIEYYFQLHDSDQEAAVDAPEYIVPLNDEFEELLANHHLKLFKVQNFHEFIVDKFGQEASKERMNKMEVFNIDGTISESEWSVARLYTVLIIQKDENLSSSDYSSKKATVAISNLAGSLPSEKPAPVYTKSVVSLQSTPIPPISDPPRFKPKSPSYEPRHVGSRVNVSSNEIQNQWKKYVRMLNGVENGIHIAPPSSSVGSVQAVPKPMEVEQYQYQWQQDGEDDDEEEDFMTLAKYREEAIELAGGEAVWDKFSAEECDARVDQIRQKYKQKKNGSGKEVEDAPPRKKLKKEVPWVEYPPRSPDHPPPGYESYSDMLVVKDKPAASTTTATTASSSSTVKNSEKNITKQQQQGENGEEQKKKKVTKKSTTTGKSARELKAIEEAGGPEVWESLDGETKAAFLEAVES